MRLESRFPRADVALQKTAHRHRKFHILPDVVPGLRLIFCQLKRQRRAHFARKSTLAKMTHALLFLATLTAQEQKTALNEIQFFKDQTLTRKMECIGRLGEMHLPVRLITRDEAITLADALGQDFRNLLNFFTYRSKQCAEKLLIQTAGSCINRQDAQICFPIFFKQRKVLDLTHLLFSMSAESIFNLADGEKAQPCFKPSFEELLLEERDLKKSRAVIDIDTQDMDAASCAPLDDMANDAGNRLLLSDDDFGERRQDAPVLVSTRIVRQ